MASKSLWTVYLGRADAWLRSPDGALRHLDAGTLSQEHVSSIIPLPLIEALWAELSQAPRGRWQSLRLRVLLSGELARPFIVGPAAGLKHWSEAQQLAEAMAPMASQLAQPCAVCLDQWPETKAAVATATPSGLIEALTLGARMHRITLTSVRPWWTLGIEHASEVDIEESAQPRAGVSSRSQMFALADADSTTILAWQGGAVVSAFSHVPALSTEEQTDFLNRLAVSEGFAADEVVKAELAPGLASANWPALRIEGQHRPQETAARGAA